LGQDLLWGVATGPEGLVLVVGENGAGFLRAGGSWQRIEPVTTGHLFTAYVSPGGTIWAAGGSPSESPGFEDQVLLRMGELHPLPRVTDVDLVAVHVDDQGSYTLVGGNLRAVLPDGPLGTVLRLGAPLAGGDIADLGDALAP